MAEIEPFDGPTDYIAANVLFPFGAAYLNQGFAGVARFVDARIGGYSPVAYSNRWLVLQSRSLPPQPRPAALAPVSLAAATRVRVAQQRWLRTITLTVNATERCYLANRRPGCYRALDSPLQGSQRQLIGSLTDAQAGISSGCDQLSIAAAVGARALVQPLTELIHAGERRAGAALTDAAQATKAALENDDSGFLTRFVAFCAR